jgi:hypothetical protein
MRTSVGKCAVENKSMRSERAHQQSLFFLPTVGDDPAQTDLQTHIEARENRVIWAFDGPQDIKRYVFLC